MRQQLRGRFHAVYEAVAELRKKTIPASSLVENLKSRLRGYFFLRRQLGKDYWHGSNAGHSSGVAQGQRSLNRCSGRDFQHEVFAPTATAAFHSQTVAAGMLLQQRPTRRVLSCATAKLLRDEAESMVPNIDPEQVRKLAGWGLTQNDRASFVGWSRGQSLLSLRF